MIGAGPSPTDHHRVHHENQGTQMRQLEGKVAVITGAARGQGRRHAELLAAHGADIIAIDMCQSIESVPYPLAGQSDLTETADLVKAQGAQVVALRADVRDLDSLTSAINSGVQQLGGLDIVIANAGIISYGTAAELATDAWNDVIDTNLTGVYYTVRAALPHLREGSSASIILTSSVLGIRALPNVSHYVAAKAGVIGLMKALALELAPRGIRVNTVNPTIVNTNMVQNPPTYRLFAPHLTNPSREEAEPAFRSLHPLPTPWVQVDDVSAAVLFLASEQARFITGLEMKIDAGAALG
jgi:(+)-trans-carveol dehydrogenase